MTETPVSALWRQAEDHLAVADLCVSRRYHRIAVSHSYYAVMYATKAAILHISGRRADSHKGVQKMFSLELVRPGLVSSEWGAEVGRLHDLRRRADYDMSEIFDESAAVAAYERAEAFLGHLRPLIDSIGDGVD
ncbi:MAG: HEPN domain-containing protein [Dehalococcoidia bacterium]|nr:HEPN domain-containing protein [Dehalococcoidia bacterium]